MKSKKNNDTTPRKSDVSKINEAINDLLDAYKLKGRFNQEKLLSSWERLMGKTIANNTGKIYMKNEVLFVEIKSAPLKNELNLSKSKIHDIFAKEFGAGVINEIIIY